MTASRYRKLLAVRTNFRRVSIHLDRLQWSFFREHLQGVDILAECDTNMGELSTVENPTLTLGSLLGPVKVFLDFIVQLTSNEIVVWNGVMAQSEHYSFSVYGSTILGTELTIRTRSPLSSVQT